MQPVKPVIQFEDLEKVDIRLGTIRDVTEVEGSRKLVELTVDFGDFTRQILVGMKGEREPIESVIGIQCAFVVNMAPRKMAGRTSEGMLFDLGFSDRLQPAFLVPERPMPDGTRAG